MTDKKPVKGQQTAPQRTAAEAAVGAARLPWVAPELREFGSMTLLTAGNGGGGPDFASELS